MFLVSTFYSFPPLISKKSQFSQKKNAKKIAWQQKSRLATLFYWNHNTISYHFFVVVIILWSLHGCCMNICFGDSLVCNKLCGGIYQQRTATTTAAIKTTNWVPHIAKVHPFGTNIPYHAIPYVRIGVHSFDLICSFGWLS